MDNLIIQQKLNAEQLARLQINYRKDPKSRKTASYYFKLNEKVQKLYDTFTHTHKQILNLINGEKDIEKEYFKNDELGKFEESHLVFSSEIVELMKEVGTVQPAEEAQGHKEHDLKLPRINLPRFAGDYIEWVPFRDLFISLVHNRQSISKVEKLHYLKSSICGEAEGLLRHISTTEGNYDAAWDLLVQRYDNKYILLNSQFKQLFSIGKANESSSSLKTLLDRTSECIQSIEHLEVENLWESIIVYMTTQRLPPDTRQMWEQQRQTDRKDAVSFSHIKDFLENRFRALEAAGCDRPKFQKPLCSQERRVFAVQNEHELSCVLCKVNHSLHKCPKFCKLSQNDKFTTVKRHRLCINCLKKGHLVANCESKVTCLKCKQSHHTLLHREISPFNYMEQTPNRPSDITSALATTNYGNSSFHQVNMNSVNILKREVLLATALVTLTTDVGPFILRALLDQGSQTSLITESAVQQLGLKRKATDVNIAGIGHSPSNMVKGIVEAQLETRNKEIIHFEALILKTLTNLIPARHIPLPGKEWFDRNQLADPHFDQPGHIDLLLGADIYAKVILSDIHRFPQGPIAQNSKLGWILSGDVGVLNRSQYQSFKVEIDDRSNVSTQLQRFWEIEEVPTKLVNSEEDEACERHFVRNVRRDKTGRYVVRLPFKNEEAVNALGHSRSTALSSLLALERRFQANSEVQREYMDCIQDYLQAGHMKLVSNSIQHLESDNLDHRNFYLPHHAVHKESTTTKCRVVFDASRKTTSGISLNDLLLTGPAIQNNMLAVLTNWRFYRYAFAADITKMYRQINLDDDDTKYQRILWRTQPDQNIQDYCLTTVTFGLTCAPFLALRTLQKLAEDEKEMYPDAVAAIKKEFYVDDLLSGGHDLSETIHKREEIRKLLKSGCFPLRKWIANDVRILDGIPLEDCEMKISHELQLEDGYKSLGIVWYPLQDAFGYCLRLNENDKPVTKRQLLSDIARLYDPLGWLAPTIIMAKILLQSLWLHGLDWDEILSEEISQNWTAFREKLTLIGNIRIPRWTNFQPSAKLELHGFCDASAKAYAAAVYLVVRHGADTHSHLIMAKTKVAPIRTISIPRLELCGAVLLAKLVRKIEEMLDMGDFHTWLWTDSQIVLAWLKAQPAKWKTFVANRTTDILSTVGNTPWRHVPSHQNPADLASRGLDMEKLIGNKLWWNGPDWLCQSKEMWPKTKNLGTTDIESKDKALVHLNTITWQHMEEILKRYSTLTRLTRVTAYCIRFGDLTRKHTLDKGYLKTVELSKAFRIWLKYTQMKEFDNEIHTLQAKQLLNKKSKLLTLNPFIDKDGLLRVGGRLTKSALSYDGKHPIILPKNGTVVELLLQQLHIETMHGGTQLMLNTLRRKFWLLDGRNTIKRIVHRCVKCFRASAKCSTQLMGDLPAARTTASRPFTHVGIDYCGPFELRSRRGRGCQLYKGYIAIFVCLSVKAIHIELVGDLTTQAFLAALQRFMSRRGFCSHIYSDCGTNFVGANTELSRILKLASTNAAEELANKGIVWHFNPPASPHFGGLWEAGVKSIKTHLRRVVGNVALTYEEMSTVLNRIEACLNSRPLCSLTDDPNDSQALTPAHFLIGDMMLALPENNVMEINMNRLNRWQLVQRLTQTFWTRWKEEYLSRLQTRPKWLYHKECPKVGDLCVVKDERLPTYRWPLAKITELHPGTDQLVRVVSLKLNGKIYKRPIAKIAILPRQ